MKENKHPKYTVSESNIRETAEVVIRIITEKENQNQSIINQTQTASLWVFHQMSKHRELETCQTFGVK